MNEVAFTINGKKVKGNADDSIIDVAAKYKIPIPTLCHDPCLKSVGACRVCLVEDEKRGKLIASCVTPVSPGISIRTNSKKVIEARKVVVKLMLASHPESCIICEKGNQCKLRQIAADLGIGLLDYYPMPHFSGTSELNPFLSRDLSKCILCAKCIRADHELVVEGAIDYIDRGFEARPATFTDGPLETSDCTFCGTCLELCPTGALFEKDKLHRGTSSKRKATTCSFCGCGCSYYLKVSQNEITGVQPGIADTVNGPTLCAKGHFGYDFISHPKRLTTPQIKKDGEKGPASWDEVLKTASNSIKEIIKKHGPESIAILCGPHCTNEEAYLINRFSNEIIKTPNVSCITTYMQNLINGMKESIGYVGSNTSISDLENAEVILCVGANPTETAPVAGYSIKRGVRNNRTKVIVIDPVKIKLTKYSYTWLKSRVDTDGFLLLALLNYIISNKKFTKTLSESNKKQLKEIKKLLKNFDLKLVERNTGIKIDEIKEIAEIFLSSNKRAIVFGNGIIQQENGADLVKVLCAIGQTAKLLTKKETSLVPVIKHSNALGIYHMGIMNGVSPSDIFNKIKNGSVKGLWVIGDDPMSSLHGGKEIENIIDMLDLLIVSDSHQSRITEKADMIFPSVTYAEKSGTVINMEGRVQKIDKVIDNAGESRSDFDVITEMAKLSGTGLKYKSEIQVTSDICKNLPLFNNMKISKKADHYYSYVLPRKSKSIKDVSLNENVTSPVKKDKKYPYTLITGSVLFHLGHGHYTKYSQKLSRISSNDYIEINPEDADANSISNGDKIKVMSQNGEVQLKAQLADRLPRGVLFINLPTIQNSSLLTLSEAKNPTNKCKIDIKRI